MNRTTRRSIAALLLFSALSAQAHGQGSTPFETWQCFNPFDFSQREVIIKLTRSPIPEGLTYSDGTLWANGLEHQTKFQVEGLERQWIFGRTQDDPPRYLFVIDQDSTGLYYDFSASEPDETVWPKSTYTCTLDEALETSSPTQDTAEAERARILQDILRDIILQEQITRDTQKLETERLALLAVGRAGYVGQIKDKIERNWLRPPGTASGLKCIVRVSQIPGGTVVSAVIQTSSGNVAFDRSVEEAVLRASPLPLPADPSLFDRNIMITFEHEG